MKPMMCFDVDGTIRGTTDEHIVYDSTILALKKLKEAGYPIVVSTGRGRDSFLRTGIQDIADWDGFVFNNGQLFTDGRGYRNRTRINGFGDRCSTIGPSP